VNQPVDFTDDKRRKVSGTLGVFLVDSHLAAVQAPAPAADDGGVGRAGGPKAATVLDHVPPVFAPAGIVPLWAGLLRPRHSSRGYGGRVRRS
jgi:hypothetical protein